MAGEKKVVVIAGPSGSGKNAIIEELLRQFPRCVRLVTATTRHPRPVERSGIDYYFFTQEEFDQEMAIGHIPEHRYVADLETFYGIYKPDLEEKIRTHQGVFAQVDIEGARYLKQAYHATTIFIMPESLEQFRGRLRARNPEWGPQEFEARMKVTEEELRLHAPQYDYRVVNADGALAGTVADVVAILKKEGYNLE